MTENQIAYQRNRAEIAEKERSNRVQEAETERHNRETERAKQTELSDKRREIVSDQYGKYGVDASPWVLEERRRQYETLYPEQSGNALYSEALNKVGAFWDAMPFKLKIGGK